MNAFFNKHGPANKHGPRLNQSIRDGTNRISGSGSRRKARDETVRFARDGTLTEHPFRMPRDAATLPCIETVHNILNQWISFIAHVLIRGKTRFRWRSSGWIKPAF